MGFENSKWLWMNGNLIEWEKATVHVSSHGLHYGSGVFEGIRCYETVDGPAVFQLAAHLERLYLSASVYGIEIPYSLEELETAIYRVIRSNGFTSCYVRPICFKGSNNLSLNPDYCPVEVAILAWTWGSLLGAESIECGIRATISPFAKFHSSMMPTTAKACGQYLNSIIAVRDAFDRGFDEALLLDKDGFIAEGAGENLFVVKNGRIFTNDEDSSILLGITRNSVIQIVKDVGYEVEITKLCLEDLLNADEAFFTGTAAEVSPLREVDGQEIGTGKRGVVTKKIQEKFFDAVYGREPNYRKWLFFVNDVNEELVTHDVITGVYV